MTKAGCKKVFDDTISASRADAVPLGAGAYVKKPCVMEKISVAIRDELSR